MKAKTKIIYLVNCSTLDEVKKLYKKLAFLFHPDKGGELKKMQALNAEYEQILNSGQFEFKSEEEKKDSLLYPEILEKLMFLEGIIIEVCGSWLWVTGNTKPVKEELKKAGLRFSKDKIAWYYRPASHAFKNHKPQSLGYIRSKYGSDVIQKEEKNNKLS